MLFHEAFDFHAIARGDALFSIFDGVALEYRDARERSLRIAAALACEGVGAGDRVALLQRNSADYLLQIIAISRITAVVVPLNYRLAPSEWVELVADAEAVMILADNEFVDSWDDACGETDRVRAKRFILNGEAPEWKLLLGQDGDSHPSTVVGARDLEQPLIQMYTSGTTGRAKGALLSHRAVTYNMMQNSIAFPHRLDPNERMLIALPMFHIAALAMTFSTIATGGCIVVHVEVDPTAIYNSLKSDDIVACVLVPAVIQLLLESIPDTHTGGFPSLKYLAYGASPIAESTLRRTIDAFQCAIVQGYGMTEMAGIATLLSEADHARALVDRPELLLSAGKAMPGTQLRVVDADGRDVPGGQVGEVLLQGQQMMSGYWKLREETEHSISDGWFHTGDAGLVDDEGYLFLRDRVKDMISSGGENIYPAEIERVLQRHPSVTEVSVIGIPNAHWGETVMAVLVCKSLPLPETDELDKFCRKYLGGFKVPRHYTFVDALPRNAAGKILKREMRDRYWRDETRGIA